jgi:hypothetical protein
MGDVSELMEETINRVRQGSLDLRSANTIGFLAGIHMKAIAEARTEALEEKASRASSGVYRSLFNRPGYTPVQEEIFDLYPQPKQEGADAPTALLPTPGESIDDSQVAPSSPHNEPRVVTIELD